MAVTKQPSGCKITRNKNKFTFEWSIKDKNHGDGQRLSWSKDVGKTNSKGFVTINANSDITKKSVTKTATKTAVTVNLNNYYPKQETKFLYGINFEIQGKRKKDGKKTFSWSAVGVGQKHLLPPNKPSLSEALDGEKTNVTKFTWNVKTSDTDDKPLADVEWQSILVKEANGKGDIQRWSSDMPGWQTGTGKASDSEEIEEDTTTLSQGSYTRFFRVRARGCAGNSEWRMASHVYARPNVPEITPPIYEEDPSKVENDIAVTETANGYEIKVSWTADASKAYPVDKTTIQYAIGIPRTGLIPPASPDWKDANISADTKGTDTAVFVVDQKLEDDQCIWVRVNVTHDREIVQGQATLAKKGYLKNPSGISVSTNDSTYRAQVTATNNSEVPDSFLVVYYKPASKGSSDGVPIGVIPHGQTSVTVQCPNWSEETAISFGVKAYTGTYTIHTGTSTSDPSSVKFSKLMESASSIWEGGDVPQAPTGVSVNPTTVTGTIKVSWNWTWSEANGAEISWSDHADAWESTDEPDTYTINNLQPSSWNIANLETGITWYIRVRLFRGVGDTVTYGPWSEITSNSTIDLATAPSKPTLLLSSPVIAHDGSVTASWVYSTNDGTDQSYAEICEATIDSTGITYGDVIAHTETAQHVTIYAEEAEWETGETYNLCVRVRSASGKLSDEWSDPQSVIVAEPLEAVITNTSLEMKDVEVDPRVFEGNPIEFETEMEEDFAKLNVELEPIQDGTPWNATTADVTPYNFRKVPSVGHSINSEYDKIVGGTVVWNQLANVGGTETINGITFTKDNGSYVLSGTANGLASKAWMTTTNVYEGHKYLLTGGVSQNVYCVLTNVSVWNNAERYDYGTGSIARCLGNGTATGYVQVLSGTTVNKVKATPQLTDLTQMLGTTIADYIYSLETATAGAGVAWLKEHFPKMFDAGYQAYDSGTLKSVEGLQSHDTVGKNLLENGFNGTTTQSGVTLTANDDGTISLNGTATASMIPITNIATGATSTNTQYDHKKHLKNGTYRIHEGTNGVHLQVLGQNGTGTTASFIFNGTTGTFVIDDTYEYNWVRVYIYNGTNTTGMTFNPMITLESVSDAAYEPYQKHTYALDSDLVLRGRFYLENGQLRADGDTYAGDGSVARRYKETDIGTLTWTKTSAGYFEGYSTTTFSNEIKRPSGYGDVTGYLLSNGFTEASSNSVYAGGNKVFAIRSSTGNIWIRDDAYSDAASFKAAMSGVYLVYEIVTPTTETADPYTNPQIVDPDGTEEYVTTSIVPVGHETYYADIYPISGHNEVSATIRGKNLLKTDDNISWIPSITKNEDGSLHVVGSRSSNGAFAIGEVELKANTAYTLSGSGNGDLYFQLLVNNNVIGYAGINPFVYTPTEDVTAVIRIFARGNITFDYLLYPQIELGSSATDYEPYSNETYTAEFDNTVYGGEVDLVSGVLTVDRAITLFTETSSLAKDSDQAGYHRFYMAKNDIEKRTDYRGHIIANACPTVNNYANFGTFNEEMAVTAYSITSNPSNYLYIISKSLSTVAEVQAQFADEPLQIVYELATPQEIQLTPQQIQTLVGENRMTSDSTMQIRITESYRKVLSLTEMPFTVTITGAGDGGTTTLAVERAEDFFIDRPNEDVFNGYDNETVVLLSHTGEDEFVVTTDNVIGSFDDGAAYRLVATVEDGLGQSNDATEEFEVHWTHQAIEPNGTVLADDENLIVRITPTKPVGALDTDVCDIYRLSADKPELIYSGAQFGTEYVDPYPTIGQFGGHRLVLRTANGDYKTEDNKFAWLEFTEEDGDILDVDYSVIDFEGYSIRLKYGMDNDSTWTKDFTETKYLGGSVQGDWTLGVSRTGNVTPAMITLTDAEDIIAMRRLANYTGICHIRTKDGSSYACNIDVSESNPSNKYGQVVTYQLKITRVDPQGFEGMKYADWLEGREES